VSDIEATALPSVTAIKNDIARTRVPAELQESAGELLGELAVTHAEL
jgi:hypothetical protein